MVFFYVLLNCFLHTCVIHCNYHCLLAILEHEVDVNHKNKAGQTALAIAASNGCIHLMEPLLQAGANPNIIDQVSFNIILFNIILWCYFSIYASPLLIALMRDDIRCMKLLLNSGANPNITNDSNPLITVAAEHSYVDAVSLLIQYNATINGLTNPPLAAAIKVQNAEIVQLLLNAKADPLATYNGQTILQFATKKKSQFVQQLTAACSK